MTTFTKRLSSWLCTPQTQGSMRLHCTTNPSPPYGYAYHYPLRTQFLSLSSLHSLDRTPFTATGYGPYNQDYMRYGEMGMGRDNKQRSRGGNLPKETTNKLRTWFMVNLDRPYPTECDKQELMRQTGLQMTNL